MRKLRLTESDLSRIVKKIILEESDVDYDGRVEDIRGELFAVWVKISRMINLIDNYVNGMRDSVNIKSAYIIRDTIKVIGTSQIPKANFAIL